MSAFACDRCGRGLLTDADVRYVVTIQVTSAYDPLEITDEDLAGDHSAELAALIRGLEGRDPTELEESVYATRRFDLCATCKPIYLADPLGSMGAESRS